MTNLTVNGQPVHTEATGDLLAFLREELRLTSVKNGCGSGACGACTVLVDGKRQKACVCKLPKLEGKRVLTVEGLSPREKDVYAFAFAACGAVQCGYCIPGMVLCAKSLLDTTPAPTREQVKQAIRGNICRCTGYQKIEDAILYAGRLLQGGELPAAPDGNGVGEDAPRLDAREKVLGTGLYADDLTLPGLLHAVALRPEHPRERVLRIDASAALALPGVVRVVTAEDVPYNRHGHLKPDWDVLIAQGDCTRYVGDALALVIAETEALAREGAGLIRVDCEALEPITCPAEALAPGAPPLHEDGNLISRQVLRRGDADAAIAAAAHVITRHYSTPFTEHAFMEPECAVAAPDGDGLLLYTGSQSVYDERREISRMLQIEPERVRCHALLVGGGFGGKEDMSVQHHAALAAWLTGRPVKVRLTRAESLRVHPKRHAMEIDMTTACDAQGNLTAMRARLVADGGAYASLSGPVLQRACTHAGGPYHFDNVDIEGVCAYTDNPPAGAFRGFGVTQSCFACESNLNYLAAELGVSPWELRYRNAIRPGESLPNGQLAGPDTAYAECLLAVRDAFESSPRAGLAGCMKNSGLGVGVPDTGRCKLRVSAGKVFVLTSAACMGQGVGTVCAQIVSSVTGLPLADIVHAAPDTADTPNAGTSTASRQTLLTGEATRRAAEALRAALDEAGSLGALHGREFLGEYGPPTDPMGSDKPHPVSHLAYGYGAQVVLLDEAGRVERVVAAHDVGRAVNPRACEGQVEGGVVMGLGYALTEDYPLDHGVPTASYGTLGLLRATDAPPIEVRLIGKADPTGPALGAKGVGEICTVPTAPAVAHALYRMDGVERRRLPIRKG